MVENETSNKKTEEKGQERVEFRGFLPQNLLFSRTEQLPIINLFSTRLLNILVPMFTYTFS